MWEISREKLLPVLEVLSLIPEKLGIPNSAYFWIRGNGSNIKINIASYLEAEVTLKGHGKWPFKQDFFLDRRTFLPFVNAAREIKDKHRFVFSAKKKQLIVTHGRRKSSFDSQEKIKGYGNASKILKDTANVIPISSDLKELLICGKNCAVNDSVVPHLSCVYITKGLKGVGVASYASSDKVHYVGMGKLGDGKIKTSIPFPLMLIPILEHKGLKRISWIGKYIVLRFKYGYIWQPISEEALAKFPLKRIQKYSLKAQNIPITFTASSRRFSRILLRLGYYLQSVRRKDWVVSLEGKKSGSYITTTTSIPGVHFAEKIDVSKVIKKDFKFDLPLDILEPVFGFLSLKTKKLGLVVRVDHKHGVAYISVGTYWFACTSQQE